MALEIWRSECSQGNAQLHVTHCKGSLFDSAIYKLQQVSDCGLMDCF